MNQEFKKKEEEKKSSFEALKEKYKSIEKTVIPKMREVKLSMMLKCGCGGWGFEVKRMVPEDSPLQDGDRIHERDLITGDQYRHSTKDIDWITVK